MHTTDLNSLLNGVVQAVSQSLIRQGVSVYGANESETVRKYMRPMVAEILEQHLGREKARSLNELFDHAQGITTEVQESDEIESGQEED